MLTLSKTTSPPKLFLSECIRLDEPAGCRAYLVMTNINHNILKHEKLKKKENALTLE